MFGSMNGSTSEPQTISGSHKEPTPAASRPVPKGTGVDGECPWLRRAS
jgi:hypothetical protein